MMDVKANHNTLLLEATGDSESDCNPIMDHEHAFGDDDDDDAQSCIYDESDTGDPFELNGWDEDEKKKKKGMVYGITSSCEDDEMQEQHHHHNKSSVSDDDDGGDSGLDESEKNRLFWEACLAS